MTRIELFKNWLKDNGANPNDCELVYNMEDKTHIGNKHGCYGFFCPDGFLMLKSMANNTMHEDEFCAKCKYNGFWTKEPQEPKTGYWVEENINEWSYKVFCSECGCQAPFEHVNNGDIYSANGYGVINKTKFCPNCGAKMVVPQESEG